MTDRQDIFAFADRLMDVLERGDREAARAMYAPDARFWHNYDNAEQTVDENMKLLDWMSRKAPKRHYRVVRRELLPDGWFQQHVLEATLANGREMRMFACCTIAVKDGLVTRVEEYVDPAQAAVLREA